MNLKSVALLALLGFSLAVNAANRLRSALLRQDN